MRRKFFLFFNFLPGIFFSFEAGKCSHTSEPAKETFTKFVVNDILRDSATDILSGEMESGRKFAHTGVVEKENKRSEDEGGFEKGNAGEVVIAGAGDVIFHGRVKSTADHQNVSPQEPEDAKCEGWWYIFKRIKPVLDKANVSIVNLESPIAKERKKATGRPPVLNGPPAAIRAMKEAGFNIFNIANNHAFDQMREGVAETCEAITDAGGEFIGGGINRKMAEEPLIKEINGIKIAFLGWTVTLNKNFNEVKTDHKPWIAVYTKDGSREKIASVRNSVDLVVVSMHWGAEFEMKESARQVEAAKDLCSAGADIILGHGPHILHKVDFIQSPKDNGKKCLVAYSLGNLLSNQGLKYRYGWTPPNMVEAKNIPFTRDGIILRITAMKKEGRTTIEKTEAIALWNENNWLDRYSKGVIPPDDIFITPLIQYLKFSILQGNEKLKLLLEERLKVIKQMVGNQVEWSDI